MGRHDHVTCVRSDGLSAVLSPLLADARIVAATLVDVDSGLVLDGWTDPARSAGTGDLDLDLLGAGHADLARAAGVVSRGASETLVDTHDGRHHLLLAVPDPHGDRLVVAVVVAGRPRHVRRARRLLRAVPIAALTDGPSLRRRPVDGAWFPTQRSGADAAAGPAGTATGDGITAPMAIPDPGRPSGALDGAAPPAAMVPGPSAR